MPRMHRMRRKRSSRRRQAPPCAPPGHGHRGLRRLLVLVVLRHILRECGVCAYTGLTSIAWGGAAALAPGGYKPYARRSPAGGGKQRCFKLQSFSPELIGAMNLSTHLIPPYVICYFLNFLLLGVSCSGTRKVFLEHSPYERAHPEA